MSKGNKSAVYNILAFVFQGKGTANNKAKEIKSSGVLDGFEIVAHAVVDKDTKGKVHIYEPGKGGVGAVFGATTGGLLAMIGGPAGVLAWVVGGAVIGGVAGKYLGRPISKGDLKKFGDTLTPNSSAFLLLLEDVYTKGVKDSLSGHNAKVVTLTVGDDLSGEIEQYAKRAK